MRILYCTDTYLPQVNGVSIVTALSADGLRRRGWSVRIVGPRYATHAAPAPVMTSSDPAGEYVGIPSVPIPFYPELRMALPTSRTVDDEVRAYRPDIVHAATEFVIGHRGREAARRAGIPLVTSYHTNFGQYAAAYGIAALTHLVERYLRGFHNTAQATLTPSEASCRHLAAIGVARAQRWGCGVDLERFSPTHRDPMSRADVAEPRPLTLLYVGRLAAEKSVEIVLRAFQHARDALPAGSIRLVIAGTGPRERALRAKAPEGTTFLGHLDRDRDLPQLFANADLFLFASCTETLGLVVLEALASGLPVIATPVGGVAEHLRHGINGVAVPERDPIAMAAAIIRLVKDPKARRQLAVGARKSAVDLGWEAELDRLDAIYRRVLVSGRPPLAS